MRRKMINGDADRVAAKKGRVDTSRRLFDDAQKYAEEIKNDAKDMLEQPKPEKDEDDVPLILRSHLRPGVQKLLSKLDPVTYLNTMLTCKAMRSICQSPDVKIHFRIRIELYLGDRFLQCIVPYSGNRALKSSEEQQLREAVKNNRVELYANLEFNRSYGRAARQVPFDDLIDYLDCLGVKGIPYILHSQEFSVAQLATIVTKYHPYELSGNGPTDSLLPYNRVFDQLERIDFTLSSLEYTGSEVQELLMETKARCASFQGRNHDLPVDEEFLDWLLVSWLSGDIDFKERGFDFSPYEFRDYLRKFKTVNANYLKTKMDGPLLIEAKNNGFDPQNYWLIRSDGAVLRMHISGNLYNGNEENHLFIYTVEPLELKQLWKECPTLPKPEDVISIANDFTEFYEVAVTPLHTVAECEKMLLKNGFKELPEENEWNVTEGSRYFTCIDKSIIAFDIGNTFKVGSRFSVVSGRTGEPCRTWSVLEKQDNMFVKVPVSYASRTTKRESSLLCISGEVTYKMKRGKPQWKLFENGSGVQEDLNAIMKAILDEDTGSLQDVHREFIMKLVSSCVKIKVTEIVDFEIYIHYEESVRPMKDAYESVGGDRLGSLIESFTSIQGLLDSHILLDEESEDFRDEKSAKVVSLFDPEMNGQECADLLEKVLWRATSRMFCDSDYMFKDSLRESMLLSANQSLCQNQKFTYKHRHPCECSWKSIQKHSWRRFLYQQKKGNLLKFHGGVLVRFIPGAVRLGTVEVLTDLVDEAGIEFQKVEGEFGSSLGSPLAAKFGMQAAEIGCAQKNGVLSSEFVSAYGLWSAVRLYITFHRRMHFAIERLQ